MMLLLGAAAVGAYFFFKGGSAPVDIGDGDYLPERENTVSFLVIWGEPLNLDSRKKVMEIMSLQSRGISGTAEVLEFDPKVLNPNLDMDDIQWRHNVQSDVLSQIQAWGHEFGDSISFVDVYSAV